MSTADPISLAQAKRHAANADTILLRATRPADLETPIGAFLRLDDGGPAYLLESVEGGERLGRYSFLGVGPRRLLEVRRARGAQEDRVGGGRESLRLGEAQRVGCRHWFGCLREWAPENQERPSSPRDERPSLPRCHPHSAMPHFPDRRTGRSRGRRSALPCIAGALRRSLLGLPRSVRRLPGPFPAVAAPVSTSHRVSLPTRAGYSSRS